MFVNITQSKSNQYQNQINMSNQNSSNLNTPNHTFNVSDLIDRFDNVVVNERKYSNGNVILHITNQYKNPANGKNMYTVVYEDNSTDDLEEDDIATYAIRVEKYKKKHNDSIPAQYKNAKSALVYVRSSCPNDISIETQRSTLFQYAKDRQMTVFQYAEDNGISGKGTTPRNKDEASIMNSLKHELGFWAGSYNANTTGYLNGKDHVILVMSVDRMGRHASSLLTFLEWMARRGIDVHFVKEGIIWNSSTPSHQKLIIQSAAMQAQQFSDITSEKVRNTQARLKKEGHYIGNSAFGFRTFRDKDGIRRLGKNKKELGVIRSIMDHYNTFRVKKISQGSSHRHLYKNELFNQLAQRCTSDGFTNRQGKSFSRQSIQNLVNKYQNGVPDNTENFTEDQTYKLPQFDFNSLTQLDTPVQLVDIPTQPTATPQPTATRSSGFLGFFGL